MFYDQSFCEKTLDWEIRKSDLHKYPNLASFPYRKKIVSEAVQAAQTNFGGRNILRKIHIKKKPAYRVSLISDEIVVRKLTSNIEHCLRSRRGDRNKIVINLAHILAEGFPFRIYRLDIRSFYESIDVSDLITRIGSKSEITPHSKFLVKDILKQLTNINGSGVPRGMALGVVLADFVLMEFDLKIKTLPGVYFYGRFVDDITIVTSGIEKESSFKSALELSLPKGLKLNEKKTRILTAANAVSPQKSITKHVLDFEYLGYQFSVDEPLSKGGKGSQNTNWRKIDISIAKSKVNKIKTRICKSLRAYGASPDFYLLRDRIHFLTSNVSIFDFSSGRFQLAGIYHSYPHLSGDGIKSLHDLDFFLKKCILEKNRTCGPVNKMLSGSQKRALLSKSFCRGHQRKIFAHFTPKRISQIQRCWDNA